MFLYIIRLTKLINCVFFGIIPCWLLVSLFYQLLKEVHWNLSLWWQLCRLFFPSFCHILIYIVWSCVIRYLEVEKFLIFLENENFDPLFKKKLFKCSYLKISNYMCGLGYISIGQCWSRGRISKKPAPATKSWMTKDLIAENDKQREESISGLDEIPSCPPLSLLQYR